MLQAAVCGVRQQQAASDCRLDFLQLQPPSAAVSLGVFVVVVCFFVCVFFFFFKVLQWEDNKNSDLLVQSAFGEQAVSVQVCQGCWVVLRNTTPICDIA